MLGLSPLPFVSPSLGLGPQMQPRLREPSSLASSPGYSAPLYSAPAVHAALPHQQQQQQQQLKHPIPPGAHATESSGQPWLSTSPQVDDACNPGAWEPSQAGPFEAQHAQRGAAGQVCIETPASFLRNDTASNSTAGSLRAEVKARGSRAIHNRPVVDPVPALQTNLTAMNAAISTTAAAVVLPSEPAALKPVTAANSSHIKQAADAAPRLAASLMPVQAAVLKPVQPGQTQAHDLQLSGSLSPAALAEQDEPVSLPAASFSPSVLQQPVSMAPTSLAPNPAQQAAFLPPGNLAPIGPPVMRTMTCQGQGASPHLAAPALLPLPPTVASPLSSYAVTNSATSADPALLPKTAASQAEPASTGVAGSQPASVLQLRPAQAAAVPEAVHLEKSRHDIAGVPEQRRPPVEGSSQRAGGGTDEQVSVSAASAVMLDEARAAGTAHQAALAVLNETVESAPASHQAEAHHSLPHPFGSAQSSLTTALGGNPQLPQSAHLLQATAVNSSTSQQKQADLAPATAVGTQSAARPQPLATVASMGPPQSIMGMTGPLPAIGQAQEADSPVGGRPSQSETAVTLGRGGGMTSAPQDLHAAHLVHVLQAHKVSQQLSGFHTQEGGYEAGQRGGSLSAGNSLPSILEAPVTGKHQQTQHARTNVLCVSCIQQQACFDQQQ